MSNSGEGRWIIVNGTHVFIKNGHSVGDAFKETTGKDLKGSASAEKGKSAKEIIEHYNNYKNTNHYAMNSIKNTDKLVYMDKIVSSADKETIKNEFASHNKSALEKHNKKDLEKMSAEEQKKEFLSVAGKMKATQNYVGSMYGKYKYEIPGTKYTGYSDSKFTSKQIKELLASKISADYSDYIRNKYSKKEGTSYAFGHGKWLG